MACPLCGGEGTVPSWVGVTVYHEEEFGYVRCRSCGTHYCQPMPDAATLARMYGPDYGKSFTATAEVDDPKQPLRTIDWLRENPPGTFLDYGCGAGTLLQAAAKVDGWQVVGLEFDPAVAQETERRTGLRVFHDPLTLLSEGIAPVDVLHLGDVVEHLTDLDHQLPEILRLVKPGGVLLSQGPLEGGDFLMSSLIRATRVLGKGGRRNGAPYHVLLATAEGQIGLFRRFGLETLVYSVQQVSWPHPARVSVSDLRRPRVLGMYAARRLSLALGQLMPRTMGNRYYYAGRRAKEGKVAAAEVRP